MKTSWPSFRTWRGFRDQKCNGASSSATTSGPNSPLIRLPANSSSRTSVSADAETYFLQTISCQNSKRSDGFLSEVVKLCFTGACPRPRDVPPNITRRVRLSKAYAVGRLGGKDVLSEQYQWFGWAVFRADGTGWEAKAAGRRPLIGDRTQRFR